MPPAVKKRRRYPFVPPSLQGEAFMRWLKRLHGWVAIWGAFIGIIIGITGITLNHRMSIGARTADEVQQFDLRAPVSGFGSLAEFDGFVSERLELDTPSVERTGRNAAQPGTYGLRYQSAGMAFDVTFVPGNQYLSVIRTDFGAISTMNALHMGNRSGLIWVLVLDAFAGSLIFLAVTGLLLWSRLHGPPLLALALMFSFLAAAGYFGLAL